MRKLQVAIVGCGRVARKHAKAVKHSSNLLRVTALIDQSIEACRNLNQEHKLALSEDDFYTSLEDLLNSTKAVDIIAITSPSGTHYTLAKAAIQTGKHVLIEKPMTLDLKEAKELCDLASLMNVKVAMGHIYRFFPLVDLIREDIVSGIYGEVLSSEVKVLWGHDQAYYNQAAWRGTWLSDGGALMNQSIHALDLMVWLLDLKTKSVSGKIAQVKHTMEAEDYGAAIFTMENDSILILEGTTITPETAHEASFLIRLEHAEIKAGLKKGKPFIEAVDRNGKAIGKYKRRLFKQVLKEGLKYSLQGFTNPHTGIYRDLAWSIENDKTTRADAESGLHSVENILAIYLSALEDNANVHLPLDDFSIREMQGYFKK